MILNKRQIIDACVELQLVSPYDEAQVQPASYDFRLSNKFAKVSFKSFRWEAGHGREVWDFPAFLDLTDAPDQLDVKEWEASHVILKPGESVLAQSQEYFRFPQNLAGTVKTKSSLGRLFISVSNGDACFFDPGFEGVAVIEVVNHGSLAVKLVAGMKIGQMIFHEVDNAYGESYAGNYQGQEDFATARWLQALKKVGTNIRS